MLNRIVILPLLLISAPVFAQEVRPEWFCDPNCPTGTEPWDIVFAEMLTSESCMPDRNNSLGRDAFRHSCTVKLACREYFFTNTLELPRPTVFIGCGHGSSQFPTQFRFPCGTLGVWIPGFDSGGGGYNGTISGFHLGEGAYLERIQIRPDVATCPLVVGSAGHGISAAGRFFLDRVLITRVQGSGIVVQTPTGGNPVLSSARLVEILNVGGRCIDIPGEPDDAAANSNQISFFEPNCVGNCRAYTNDGTTTSTMCEELREQGKLGNAYYSLHVNNPLARNLRVDQPAARSQFFALYVEDGVAGIDSVISTADIWGGQGDILTGSAWGRFGGRENGLASFRVIRDLGASEFDFVRVGDNNFSPNAFFGVQATDNTRLTWTHDQTANTFRLKTGLLSDHAIDFATDENNEVRIPRLSVGGGSASQGSGGEANILTITDCTNPPAAANWPQGSIGICLDVASSGTSMLVRCGASNWCPLSAGAPLP